jgi:2-polyprenyl-6-methoxyphenol hydroxylase-like FAD-dependent oxidoreductase
MMLGLLLARAGLDVVVLEKHADFLRDFRGDTIHPSTLDILDELALLEGFLALPHQEVSRFQVQSGDRIVTFADFSHLPTRCRFVAFVPQWDFLDFLADHASSSPAFALRMRTEVVDLLQENGTVVGVRARGPEGELEVRADLVVGCDGRDSVVRRRAELPLEELGAPMDVLWFRISKQSEDPGQAMGRLDAGRIVIAIDRGEHWQCGYVVPKGGADEVKERGLAAFRADVGRLLPFLTERTSELRSWDEVPLLSVRIDRLTRWHRPGLLCIGDAAHAMSPVGGVGINLAVQDAVATANLLVEPLRNGPPVAADLARVQARRQLPTRITQSLQVLLQSGLLRPALERRSETTTPAVMRLVDRVPALRRIPGRLIGMGVRPEHMAPGLRRSAGGG